jgi:5,6-dimethylbenzimidazole synthase
MILRVVRRLCGTARHRARQASTERIARHIPGSGRQAPLRCDAEFRARLRVLLAWRRDVRRFRCDPLPEGAVERLLELACLAPSVGLSQPWRFVLVNDPSRRAEVRRNFAACNAEALADQTPERAAQYARLKLAGLDDAPCHIAVFADRETTQGHGLGRYTMSEMIEYSAVAAVHTLWLAARAEGIGMGWVSILDPRTITAILDVPANWKLIGYFCLGFPEADDDMPVLQRLRWEERRPAASFLLRR